MRRVPYASRVLVAASRRDGLSATRSSARAPLPQNAPVGLRGAELLLHCVILEVRRGGTPRPTRGTILRIKNYYIIALKGCCEMPDLCDSSVFDKCNKEIEPKGYEEVMKICVSIEIFTLFY